MLGPLVALAGFLMVGPASAQLTVDRLSLVLPVTPGEPRLGVLTVQNDGDRAVQAVVRLEDWDRAEDGTSRWYPLGTVPGSCGPALQVFPPTISLEPGASQAIRMTVDSTPLEGECWVAVMVETANPPPSASSAVGYRIRTATKVYVQPPGLTVGGEVESLRVVEMAIEGDSARTVEVVFANTGNRHVEGKGEVQVRAPNNEILYTIPLPTAYVLSGARARVRAAFPDLPAGRYALLAVIDYGGVELAAAQSEYQVP